MVLNPVFHGVDLLSALTLNSMWIPSLAKVHQHLGKSGVRSYSDMLRGSKGTEPGETVSWLPAIAVVLTLCCVFLSLTFCEPELQALKRSEVQGFNEEPASMPRSPVFAIMTFSTACGRVYKLAMHDFHLNISTLH